MNVSIGLFFYLRLLCIFMTIFGLLFLYKDYNLVHFVPVLIVDGISLFVCRLKSKANSMVKLTTMRLIGIFVFFIVMSSIGFMGGYDEGSLFYGVLCLWFYAYLAVCLLGIVMPSIFSDEKGKISCAVNSFSCDSSANSANGQTMTGYTDSSGCLPGCGTPSWPAEPYRSNSSNNYDW